MSEEILLHQLIKNLVAEMLTTITYDGLRRTKTSKNNVSQKLFLCICFYVLGETG